MNGCVKLIRYADDFVICAEQMLDVERIQTAVRRRFQKFGLELSEEKTRVVQFGRHTAWNSSRRYCNCKCEHGIRKGGSNKPGTFNFLGFTHYCTTNRKGKFKVSRKTERKRFIRGLRKMGKWLKHQRNRKKLAEIWETVSQMLAGHYRYYGVSDNIRQLKNFFDEVKRLVFKWLNRRSQKRSFTWARFVQYLKTYPLPTPRIYHSMYC